MSNLGAIVKTFAAATDRAAAALDRGLRSIATLGRPRPRAVLIPIKVRRHR